MGPGPAPPSLTSTETGSRIVRAGHKRYFFDLGSNNKGHYLRITEVGCARAPAGPLACVLAVRARGCTLLHAPVPAALSFFG